MPVPDSGHVANLAAAQAALRTADWQAARTHFQAALRDNESAEALDGLGLAHWWLNDVGAAHDCRSRAYLAYKQHGNLRRIRRRAHSHQHASCASVQCDVRARVGSFIKPSASRVIVAPCLVFSQYSPVAHC